MSAEERAWRCVRWSAVFVVVSKITSAVLRQTRCFGLFLEFALEIGLLPNFLVQALRKVRATGSRVSIEHAICNLPNLAAPFHGRRLTRVVHPCRRLMRADCVGWASPNSPPRLVVRRPRRLASPSAALPIPLAAPARAPARVAAPGGGAPRSPGAGPGRPAGAYVDRGGPGA